jgi:hypothetical protein
VGQLLPAQVFFVLSPLGLMTDGAGSLVTCSGVGLSHIATHDQKIVDRLGVEPSLGLVTTHLSC